VARSLCRRFVLLTRTWTTTVLIYRHSSMWLDKY